MHPWPQIVDSFNAQLDGRRQICLVGGNPLRDLSRHTGRSHVDDRADESHTGNDEAGAVAPDV
jgi:hypothetical protein